VNVRDAKKLIPRALRKCAREYLHQRAVRRALKPLRANGKLTIAEIAAFHTAWGNVGFAADRDYLSHLLRLLSTANAPVLECGSGGTTLLANEIGLRRGFKIYSLEQDPEWAQPVQRALTGRSAVTIFDSPLRTFGGYHWYDVRQTLPLPAHFALVICDGPYISESLGEPSYSAWRYGVLPWFKQTDRTFDALLLDDVNDKRAPAILDRWKREFGIRVERFASDDGECAIIAPTSEAISLFRRG